MARNRKSQSAAIRFGPALKAFLLCLLIGGSGIGYVWQKDQIGRLGGTERKTAKTTGGNAFSSFSGGANPELETRFGFAPAKSDLATA